MKSKFTPLLVTSLLLSTQLINAQTLIDFEDVVIPDTFVSLSTSMEVPTSDENYYFTSLNGNFSGLKTTWGGYNYFDCSKSTDSISESWMNDKAAIAGAGNENSEQYAIAYLPSMWPTLPNETYPYGFALSGSSEDSRPITAYFTNSTYTYRYILNNLESVSFLNLIIRGYNDGEINTDSIIVKLYEKTSTDTTILRAWEPVNLLSLGIVDSITFQLKSDDDYIPFYFCMDDILMMDNECGDYASVTELTAFENTVTVKIDQYEEVMGLVETMELALDQNDTYAPTGEIISTSDTSYIFSDLSFNTEYVLHFRSKCIGGAYSDWDTLHITTDNKTAIVNPNGQLSFSIYPNPSKDYLYINGLENGSYIYEIMDIKGKTISSGISKEKIEISSLSSGVYLIKISNEEKFYGIKKFIKE